MGRAALILMAILISGCAHWSISLTGTCPDHHRIKGNADSFYYHLPTDSYYYVTRAEFCFESSEVARRQGYTRTPR
jgi:hypothetical protein